MHVEEIPEVPSSVSTTKINRSLSVPSVLVLTVARIMKLAEAFMQTLVIITTGYLKTRKKMIKMKMIKMKKISLVI